MRKLPSGRVTFAFADVVGSTQLFAQHGQRFVAALAGVQALIADLAERHGGAVVNTAGDGAFLAFGSAEAARRALTELQHRIETSDDPGLRLRLRTGMHTGDAEPIGHDYVAFPVHVASRVAAAAGPGQVLASRDAVADLTRRCGTELGSFVLKDIPEPVSLWRIIGDDTPPRAAPVRRTNVPDPHTTFLGRTGELSRLDELLIRPGVVTVVGTGGLGKTRLVSEFARSRASSFADGIWLVELGPLGDMQQVVAAVGQVLGLQGNIAKDAVVDTLAQKHAIVIVLDNCEHVIDDVAECVDDWRVRCPGLRVLCTSREPLDLAEERILRVSPLDCGGASGGAVDLFVDRSAQAGRAVDLAQRELITDICIRLDGLPLAIELAAARSSDMNLTELRKGLDDGMVRLARRGGAERQRSLEATVTWSLRLLGDPERDALLALSILPGRFPDAMARQVLDELPGVPTDAAHELARRSLLDLDGSEYRMLATVREVAQVHLLRRPELASAAYDALYAWAVDANTERNGSINHVLSFSADQARALEVALAWGLDRSHDHLDDVTCALRFWSLTNSISQNAVALARRILSEGVPTDARRIAAYSHALPLAQLAAAAHEISAAQLRALLDAAHACGDEEVLVLALSMAAKMLDRGSDEARAYLHEAIERAEWLPKAQRGSGARYGDVGVAHHVRGELQEAEQFYRKGLDFATDIDDLPNQLILSGNLGELLLDLDRAEEASGVLREGLRLAVGRPRLSAWMLGLLAEAVARCGAIDEAQEMGRQAESELQAAAQVDANMTYYLDRLIAVLAETDSALQDGR